MYLRRSTVRRSGKTHTYWRLVRSVRRGAKVRQETVATLGALDAAGRAKASALARHFLGPAAHQRELFEDTASDEIVRVRTGRVRVERSRSFGDVWLAWTLWRVLGLDEFCRAVQPHDRERVPWADVISILVLARFCEPSSELHIAESWYPQTALDDILGVRPDLVHSERLYRGLDRLLRHKDALQRHLKARLGDLFALDYDLMLYDVTSTYFEGSGKANPKAQRGYSRDGRSDCKQVCIGLVVTREGFPVGYELFAGNRTDVTTVREIVETMERRYGKAKRIWVMDRGMTSEDNLEWLRQGGRRYLVGTPRSELRKWRQAILESRGWNEIREGLEVKLCEGPDGAETFILCRSASRQAKEEAIHERFAGRIVAGLESLARRIDRSTEPLDPLAIGRQIGRLFQKNSRAAAKFDVRLVDDASRRCGVRLIWHEKRDWTEWAALAEGTYILRSNVTDWSAEDLWTTYVQLTQAEAAFRISKSELQIRPIWHQREDRIEAHILVCFLAYAMWKTLEGWMRRAGIGNGPRKLLDRLKRLVSVDVVLPVVDGPELRLRCVVRPDPEQADLLDRLGLRLPERLRPAEARGM